MMEKCGFPQNSQSAVDTSWMILINRVDVNEPCLVYFVQGLANNMQKKTMRARKSGNTSI